MYTICCGMIGWMPEAFWNASFIEAQNAIEGFAEFNGGEKSQPLRKDELAELKELYPD